MIHVIMTTREVQIITQKSEGYCRRIIRIIKKELYKEQHQKITVTEFSNYYGLDIKEVQEAINEYYAKNKVA